MVTAVSPLHRLQWEEVQQKYVILYPEGMVELNQSSAEILKLCVEAGGCLTGEHGVGVLKQPYLELALGKTVIELQRNIKKVFDPKDVY